MNHGNLEHKLVAIILCGIGMLLMPWGVYWLAVVGTVLGAAGVVVFFLGPLIWFLAELATPPIKRLFSHGPKNPGSKNDPESFSTKN